MSNLDQALDYLLEEEGGWSDNKNDRGGKTMYGITQSTYDGFRKKQKLPLAPVRDITKEEAKELYQSLYWNAASCNLLPWPISYLTFDAAVNSGPSRAVRWTQAGLGTKADGQVGPTTLTLANNVVAQGIGSKLIEIVDQRVQFLSKIVKDSESQEAFLLGWWRRTIRVLARALLSSPEENS